MEQTIGIETWGKGRRSLRGKKSKLDLITEISKATNTKVLDIGDLNLQDLQAILDLAESDTRLSVSSLPTGRAKAPYVECLREVLPKANLSKLSIAALKDLIGALNE